MIVIITSPSLSPKNNVSGIATLTRLMISLNKDVKYHLFEIGRRDYEKRGILWALKQLFIPVYFFFFLKKNKPDIVHLNVPFKKEKKNNCFR